MTYKEKLLYRLHCLIEDAKKVADTISNDGVLYNNLELLQRDLEAYKAVVVEEPCDGCNSIGWRISERDDGRHAVERCDTCQKLDDDFAAAIKAREVGIDVWMNYPYVLLDQSPIGVERAKKLLLALTKPSSAPADDDDDSDPPCTNPSGHEWAGPSEDHDRVYCIWCGADGDA